MWGGGLMCSEHLVGGNCWLVSGLRMVVGLLFRLLKWVEEFRLFSTCERLVRER